MLSRQAVVCSRTSIPDIVRIGDTAREREQVAFAQRIGALVGWDDEVLSPACSFKPAFPAQGCNHLVRRFCFHAQQFYDLRPVHFPPFLFGKGKHDPALLR